MNAGGHTVTRCDGRGHVLIRCYLGKGGFLCSRLGLCYLCAALEEVTKGSERKR